MAAHWSTVLAVISTRAFDGDVLQDEDVHPRMVTQGGRANKPWPISFPKPLNILVTPSGFEPLTLRLGI